MSEFFDDVNFYNGGSSGAPGPVFAALLPTAGKAYVLGNVGVGTINPQNALDVEGGTNTPGAKLDVAGTMQVSQSAFLSVAGGSVGVGTNAPGAKLDVAGTTRVSQDAFLAVSSGSVGIGTSTPVNKLDVSGDVAIQGKHALRGSDSWLRLNQDGAFASGVHTPGNFAPNSLNVGGAGGWGNPGAGNVWVTGRVGLGTQRPLYRLHALAPGGFGGEDANGVSLEGNVPVVAQSDSTAIGILNAQGRQAFALNVNENLGTTGARGVPIFYDKYDGNWHPSLSLKMGSVGVGTSSPINVAADAPDRRRSVHVAGPLTPAFVLEQTYATGSDKWAFFLSSAFSDLLIRDINNNADRLKIRKNNGYVGIGPLPWYAPEAILDVGGDLKVRGNITFTGSLTGGAKGGYVMDQFVNKVGEGLEEGDVVVIGKNQASLYYGANNNIPIPEIDIARRTFVTRVCGVVCEIYTEIKSEVEEETDPTAAEVKRPEAKIAKKRVKPEVQQRQAFTAEQLAKLDRRKIAPGQIGWMVTLGTFAHCKVDADIAPIEVGDLLTTSPTRGHAQKVADPAKAGGAIVGKALGAMRKGKGKIPVLVSLK